MGYQRLPRMIAGDRNAPTERPSNNPVIHLSNNPFLLALPLFVSRIGANDADDAFALNDFAVFAKFLN